MDTGGLVVERIGEADSPDWAVRAFAGQWLADNAEVPGVQEVLHRLLLDTRDTGVTQHTANALLKRQDVRGLRMVLAAYSAAQQAVDFDTFTELDAAVSGDPRWMTETGCEDLRRQFQELAGDSDAGIRREAHLYLSTCRPLEE